MLAGLGGFVGYLVYKITRTIIENLTETYFPTMPPLRYGGLRGGRVVEDGGSPEGREAASRTRLGGLI